VLDLAVADGGDPAEAPAPVRGEQGAARSTVAVTNSGPTVNCGCGVAARKTCAEAEVVAPHSSASASAAETAGELM
jgi:hypothetical protein